MFYFYVHIKYFFGYSLPMETHYQKRILKPLRVQIKICMLTFLARNVEDIAIQSVLKSLKFKKVSIKFVAIKNVPERNFVIHVLYVNNGWAFDTNSQRQYPIEKIYKIYRAKVYRTFNFNKIAGKSFDVFKAQNKQRISTWCYNNNCSPFVEGDPD